MENLDLSGVIVTIIIMVVVLGLVLGFLVFSSDSQAFSPYKRRRLLTNHEIVMLAKLRRALHGTNYDVFPQVSMGALIDLKRNVDHKKRLGLRNRFDRKVVDFVIANSDGFAVLLIELDDYTHSKAKDMARDQLTRSAGYKTLRYRGAKGLDPRKIREDIKDALKEDS